MTNNTIGDASNEIVTVLLDGTHTQQITNNTWADWFPTYSPCGDLMYVSQKVCSSLSLCFSFFHTLTHNGVDGVDVTCKVEECDDDVYSIPAMDVSEPNGEASSSRLPINMCHQISDADPYASKVSLSLILFFSLSLPPLFEIRFSFCMGVVC